MGYWGTGPYENDGAIDWLAMVVGHSVLDAAIEETLMACDAGTQGDEIRAAASLQVRLRRIALFLGNEEVLLALAERRLTGLVANCSDAERRGILEAQLSEFQALRAGT